MGQMTIHKNAGGIPGLCLLEPKVHRDERGFFMETYHRRDLSEAGLDYTFVQTNQSRSVKGVLRGLHYQKEHPQAKLIRVCRGEVYDVAVDLRRDSAAFGRHFGVLLSEENKLELLIPRGFAHGFLTLSDTADVCYLCDDFFCPGDGAGIAFDDPDLGIEWPKCGAPLILSGQDRNWPGVKTAFRL